MIRFIAFFIGIFFCLQVKTQDIQYVRFIDSTLSSPQFAGRGYVDDGEHKAALFIAKEMQSLSLKKFDNQYFQPFKFSINTIVKDAGVSIDGKVLESGIEYMVAANSKSLSGTFDIVFLPDSIFDNKELLQKFFQQKDLSDKFILTEKRFIELKYLKKIPAKGMIYVNPNKLYWHVSRARSQKEFVTIDIKDSLISKDAKQITIGVEAKFIKKYHANNVIGYVQGKKYPDSFLVFTAHFDHLGKMGQNIYFPGASDNASGVSVALDLARHLSKPENQPDYSVAIILVSGEEVGLLGSTHYTKNPLFPLKSIKWVINMDMVGTGSDGISVVNGILFPEIYDKIKKINDEKNYLTQIVKGGESCNSDHCPFAQKGVPSVFIFTRGDENREYHTITDTYERMHFTEHHDLFNLFIDFINL